LKQYSYYVLLKIKNLILISFFSNFIVNKKVFDQTIFGLKFFRQLIKKRFAVEVSHENCGFKKGNDRSFA